MTSDMTYYLLAGIGLIITMIVLIATIDIWYDDLESNEKQKLIRDSLYQEGIKWYNEQVTLPKWAIQFTTVNNDRLQTAPYNPDYRVDYYTVYKYTSLDAATEAMNGKRLTSLNGIHVDVDKVVLMQLVEVVCKKDEE